MTWRLALAVVLVASAAVARAALAEPVISGVPRVWHPLTLSFSGPHSTQTSNDPNPFLDFRLQVRFTGPAGQTLDVPGYFDGDGKGGPEGNTWRARFMPPVPGRWRYQVSFRRGPGVPGDLAENVGDTVLPDGTRGEFDVAARDPAAPGLLRWGLLRYTGKHYLKFADGPYWLKGGCDEPENFLAYAGFVNTPPSHAYAAHEEDWREGDPDWGNGKGRAIIGAINYLGSMHVNSLYFLTMNIGGDGRDVWPWAGAPNRKGSPQNANLHFDLAKLGQWEIVLAHAQRKGIVLHVVLDEAEEANKRELDDGELGPERKVYYRELVARFGHHPGLQWNLCEEYNIGGLNLGPERVRRFAAHLRALDPYDHPITVHSAGDPLQALEFTFGDPLFDLTSVQLGQKRIDLMTEAIRDATARAGRPLPAAMDEFTVDKGTNKSHIPVDDAVLHRKQKLWPTYLSGGSIEFILEGLLRVDSFKTPEREALWKFTWHARDFLEGLPFWEMAPADHLSRGAATLTVGVGGGKPSALPAQVLAKPGDAYALYFPRANRTGQFDLSNARGDFTLRWYDPRLGRYVGDPRPVAGGRWIDIGPPPGDLEEDWAIVVRKAERVTATAPRGFPGRSWVSRAPAELGLAAKSLDDLALSLGGRGYLLNDGDVVKAWGDQERKSERFSAAMPITSTLMRFAPREGQIRSADQPVAGLGRDLRPKDRTVTFRHLSSMTGGYARPERSGEAWAHNDSAIMLHQKTLFERVFQGESDVVANAPGRFGALEIEDGLAFRVSNRRLGASTRDFARMRPRVLALFASLLGAMEPTAVPPSRAVSPIAQRGYYFTFMRMPTYDLADWKRIVDGVRDDGGNVILLWIAGAFRSRRFPETWRYNQEHANIRRDFVTELIDHAHARGLAVVLALTPFGYDGVNKYGVEHPEVRAVRKDGEQTPPFGIGCWGYNLCPSKPAAVTFMEAYTREILDAYPRADGLMFESSDYAICHCESCGPRFFEREFAFVRAMSDEVWRRKANATVIVYPRYFAGAEVPGLGVKGATHAFDPRWTLFFTPHSAPVEPSLIHRARSSIWWDDAPARRDPLAIQAGARRAREVGATGYVPSFEAYTFLATDDEEGQSWLKGRRQVPFGFGWLPAGDPPFDELLARVQRVAYREFTRDPDLDLGEFRSRLGHELLGPSATTRDIEDLLALQAIFTLDRTWCQPSPVACPDRVEALVSLEALTPAKRLAYRTELDRVRAIAERARGRGPLAPVSNWLLEQWNGRMELLRDAPP